MELMDTFEAARQKHAKNLERRTRNIKEPAAQEVPAQEIQAPKEKPKSAAAFIHVKVVLPDRELSVCLMRPQVYQNVVPNRLTKSEIKKCVEDGFRPLLGGLDDVPGSGN